MPSLVQAVRAAADEARGEADTIVWLVCLGGLEVLAAADVADGRTLIAPGGLRWLGDLRWAAHVGDARSQVPVSPA